MYYYIIFYTRVIGCISIIYHLRYLQYNFLNSLYRYSFVQYFVLFSPQVKPIPIRPSHPDYIPLHTTSKRIRHPIHQNLNRHTILLQHTKHIKLQVFPLPVQELTNRRFCLFLQCQPLVRHILPITICCNRLSSCCHNNRRTPFLPFLRTTTQQYHK